MLVVISIKTLGKSNSRSLLSKASLAAHLLPLMSATMRCSRHNYRMSMVRPKVGLMHRQLYRPTGLGMGLALLRCVMKATQSILKAFPFSLLGVSRRQFKVHPCCPQTELPCLGTAIQAEAASTLEVLTNKAALTAR